MEEIKGDVLRGACGSCELRPHRVEERFDTLTLALVRFHSLVAMAVAPSLCSLREGKFMVCHDAPPGKDEQSGGAPGQPR